MRCYKRLLRFGKIKSNLRSVREEIKEDYKKGAVRTKRLRRDSSETDGVSISRLSNVQLQRNDWNLPNLLQFAHFYFFWLWASGKSRRSFYIIYRSWRYFGSTSVSGVSFAQNFLRSKVHFQNLEVRCDWSTRLAARFSRRSLGRKDCVTSQKNVCVGGYLVVSALDSGSRGPGSSHGRVIVLCSWARHFTLTVPLSTQE